MQLLLLLGRIMFFCIFDISKNLYIQNRYLFFCMKVLHEKTPDKYIITLRKTRTVNTFREALSSTINKWICSSNFQTEFCSIVSLYIVNVWNVWKCVTWIYVCGRVVSPFIFKSTGSMSTCQLMEAFSAFLVYIPQVKISAWLCPWRWATTPEYQGNKEYTHLHSYHKSFNI